MLGGLGALNKVGVAVAQSLAPSSASLNLDFTLGSLDSRITFTRASTATFFDSAGVLTSAAVDVARFDYNPSTLAPRGLLIEEQRTNSIRNNTMQGAVAGTPGTVPTNWLISTATGNLTTREIVGTGVENGITYIDVRFVASGSFTASIYADSSTGIAASNGQTWTSSFYVKLVGGSLTNVTVQLSIVENDAGGNFLAGADSAAFVPTAAALSTQRQSQTRTNTNASTAFEWSRVRVTFSGAGDVTLRIGLPQLELGAFATSVIPTTTTALTRNADVASMTGTNFSSWFNASEGAVITNFAFVGLRSVAGQRIITFDDGSSNNLLAQSAGSTNSIVTSITDATASQMSSTSPATAFAANTEYKMGFGYALNNSVAAVNGTAGTVDTSCTIPSGITTFRFSASSAASTSNCWFQRIAYYPARLANAQLQALTS